MDPADLERLVDEALKRLPAPRAPDALLPRVLAATVHRPLAPWYRRPWVTWPLAWQAASVVVLVALGVGLLMARPFLQRSPLAIASPQRAADLHVLADAAASTRHASTLVRVCWQVFLAPVASWLLALALSFALACGVLWAALERLLQESGFRNQESGISP